MTLSRFEKLQQQLARNTEQIEDLKLQALQYGQPDRTRWLRLLDQQRIILKRINHEVAIS